MQDYLGELAAARDQMQSLFEVAVGISSDLELEPTLHRIITAVMSMTGARYGAIGVWGTDGRLNSFVHAGMDPVTAQKVGRLPGGKGVLGLLREATEPVRLADLTDHPAAVGFPEHHPAMRAFLGAPIAIRGGAFGSLFVSDDRVGRVFTGADEVTARALASAAAAAISNAQLFDRARASARWANASRDIMTALLSGVGQHVGPLELIAERAMQLTDAEQAILLTPTDGGAPAAEVTELVVSTAVGLHATEVIDQRVPVHGSTTGEVFRSGTPVITESLRYPIPAFTDVGERPAIVMPLRAEDTVLGVIAVARNAAAPAFDPGYLQLVSDFADHAAIALTLAAARDDARELALLTDRERIAHDLHDQVIQRLFSAGLNLQTTIAYCHSAVIAQRLNQTIDELQGIIDHIRTTIFELHAAPGRHDLQQRIQDAVATLTDNRDIATTVRTSGPLAAVSPVLAEHAEAVIVEALSNAVRHSGATTVTVHVTVNDELSIDVIDNGCGIPADNQRRSGLTTMACRAEQNGGTCQISSPATGGTRVLWTAPLINP
ncbi:MAG TPA: GAF domain-containing protein [Mycobacterium sp.]|nr:GAF domain-containing protein [Mycobacterium sp.]